MSMVKMLNKCFCGLISYGLSIGFRYSMLGTFIILTSCVIVIYRSNSLEKEQGGYTQTVEVYGGADCGGCEHKPDVCINTGRKKMPAGTR